jgi:hypothetical protein
MGPQPRPARDIVEAMRRCLNRKPAQRHSPSPAAARPVGPSHATDGAASATTWIYIAATQL